MATKENREAHNSVLKASDDSMAKAKKEPAPLPASKGTKPSTEETCAEGVVIPVAKEPGDPCHRCCGKHVAGRRLFREGEEAVIVCKSCFKEEEASMTKEELAFQNKSIADSKRATAINASQAKSRKVGGTVDKIALQLAVDPKYGFIRVRTGGGFMVGKGGITKLRKILATYNYKFATDRQLVYYFRQVLGFNLHEDNLQRDGKTIKKGWENSVLCFIKEGFVEGCTNFGICEKNKAQQAKDKAAKKAKTIAAVMEEFKKNPKSWLESDVCKNAIANVKGVNKKVLLIAAVGVEAKVNPNWKDSDICKKAKRATRSMEEIEKHVSEQQLESDDEQKPPAMKSEETTETKKEATKKKHVSEQQLFTTKSSSATKKQVYKANPAATAALQAALDSSCDGVVDPARLNAALSYGYSKAFINAKVVEQETLKEEAGVAHKKLGADLRKSLTTTRRNLNPNAPAKKRAKF